MNDHADRPLRKTLTAFAIIYFVWGSTFLAIRVGVAEVPPFLLAGLRFLIAGLVLLGWALARGERAPAGRQWFSVIGLAAAIFVMDYGSLFWAEQRVPSGVAAVVLATIPAFMALGEIIFLRTQRLTLRLALALAIGIAGVAVLTVPSLDLGGAPVDRVGAVVLVLAAMSWSVASIFTRRLPLPQSKTVSSGAQMLAGGAMLLLLSAGVGEFRGFHPAAVSMRVWLALAYLIVAGSIVGFTAYLWLIHHESPTKVGTYAYVNPLVAVILGYFWAGEGLGPRTSLGTLLVLASVVIITTAKAKKPAVEPLPERVPKPAEDMP